MALGAQVAELKAKVTSRRICETTDKYVKMESNAEGTCTGKLGGHVMFTVTTTRYMDGTGVSEVKSFHMGPEGEMATGVSRSLLIPAGPGKATVRSLIHMHSEHPRWTWVNTTPMAMESTFDFQTGEYTGHVYDWK
jgi:hypothetical protein